MANWKKVIVSGSAAALSSLTLDTGLTIGGVNVPTNNTALLDSECAGLAALKLTTGTFLTADQTKLDGIAASANNYSHPTSAGNKHIPTGGTSGQFLKYTSSGTAVWAADNNTTYSVGDGALTQKNFTTTLKNKLDGIESAATADQTDAEIQSIVGGMVTGNTESGITVAYQNDGTLDFTVASQTANDFTNTLKTKLDGIETSATADQTAADIAGLLSGNSSLVTMGGALTVTGDLTVNGTTTTIDTTNMTVEDQFILLNNGNSADDAGLVVDGAGVSFGWDQSESRWGFDASGATEGQTSIASDAYAVAAVTSDVAAYQKNGNIRVEGGEIYIYVE